jgi:hypothetical protein
MAPGNIWPSFGTAGVEGDVYAVELTRASVVPAMQENVRRESVSRSLSWVLEAPYSLTTSTESGTSVIVNYGTLLDAQLAGSGSGVIADLSAATGGGGGNLYTFTGGTTMTGASGVLAYGWTFTVSATKTIKGAGVYDAGQNGLTQGFYVSLGVVSSSLNLEYQEAFDYDGNITYITVPSGTQAGLSGVWRRVDLPSGTAGWQLTPGQTYVLYMAPVTAGASIQDLMVKGASGLTLPANVVYGANVTTSGGSSFTTVSADGTAYFGPMIFFE